MKHLELRNCERKGLSMTISYKGDVYVITYQRNDFPIGRIKQDTLYLDSPSRHRNPSSYGIDKAVLTSDIMDYHYVIIRERNLDWTTTRKFWLDHGKVIDLSNGRTEMFLVDELFGADKAMLYDEYCEAEVQKLIKKDIFDFAEDSKDWKELDGKLGPWQRAIDIEERYKQSLKFKRKIAL